MSSETRERSFESNSLKLSGEVTFAKFASVAIYAPSFAEENVVDVVVKDEMALVGVNGSDTVSFGLGRKSQSGNGRLIR